MTMTDLAWVLCHPQRGMDRAPRSAEGPGGIITPRVARMLRAKKGEGMPGRQNQECSNNNDHSQVLAGDRALILKMSSLYDHDHYPILWMRKSGTKDTKLAQDEARKHDSLSVQGHGRKSLPGKFYRLHSQVRVPQPGSQGPANASNIGSHASQISTGSICKQTVTRGFLP